MPIDYAVWIVENARRRFLVDLGFSVDLARARERHLIHDRSQRSNAWESPLKA